MQENNHILHFMNVWTVNCVKRVLVVWLFLFCFTFTVSKEFETIGQQQQAGCVCGACCSPLLFLVNMVSLQFPNLPMHSVFIMLDSRLWSDFFCLDPYITLRQYKWETIKHDINMRAVVKRRVYMMWVHTCQNKALKQP